jgi:hypothetical protein
MDAGKTAKRLSSGGKKDLYKVDANIDYQEPLDCRCNAREGHPHLRRGAMLTLVVFLSVISVV